MKPVARLATLAFSIVALGHAARLAFAVTVVIGGWVVPMWLSILGAIAPATLAVALWREGHAR